MAKIGYIRVSTQDQNTARQIDGLKGFCDDVMIEKVSAAAKQRPVYDRVMKRLQPGDTFVIWDLDRAFRSTADALLEADTMRQRKIGFQIVNLNLDTSTEIGEFVYTLWAALAQFERRTLSRRTREGMAAAKRRGKRIGRPVKINRDDAIAAHLRLKDGESMASVARKFDVAPLTLKRALKTHVGEISERSVTPGSSDAAVSKEVSASSEDETDCEPTSRV